MDLDRRQTITALGGLGVLAVGGIGASRYASSPASANSEFTVKDVTAQTTDGTISNISVAGEGTISWERVDPTLLELFLSARREGREIEWGIDPIVHEDALDESGEFEFTLEDIWSSPISLSDSPEGGYDMDVFQPGPDEQERSVTLTFEFSGVVMGEEVSTSFEASDTATVTVERDGETEPTASLGDTVVSLEIVE